MIYRYKETGDLYSLLHEKAILCGDLKHSVEDRQMVCYLQHKTGKVCVKAKKEFDSEFERVEG